MYEYDRRHPHKLVYVALSRYTDIIRLYLTHAKGDHSFCHARENLDHDLLDEFRGLGSHHLPTFTKAYASRLAELQYAFSLAALNVRSLRLHAPDVVHETLVKWVSLLCLSETWSDFFVQIDGYTGVACDRRVDSRAG